MSPSELTGRSIYADANILIYAVERHPAYAEALESLLRGLDDGRLALLTSELTIAEVLAGAIKANNALAIDSYTALLARDGPVRTIPIDRPILTFAAEVRARFGGKLPDAIHVATALSSGCEIFLTNDGKLHRPSDLIVLPIGQLTPG